MDEYKYANREKISLGPSKKDFICLSTSHKVKWFIFKRQEFHLFEKCNFDTSKHIFFMTALILNDFLARNVHFCENTSFSLVSFDLNFNNTCITFKSVDIHLKNLKSYHVSLFFLG